MQSSLHIKILPWKAQITFNGGQRINGRLDKSGIPATPGNSAITHIKGIGSPQATWVPTIVLQPVTASAVLANQSSIGIGGARRYWRALAS